MTDYTEAARREATVRLSDRREVDIFFNPAGDGWLEAVIGSYDPHTEDVIFWDVNGRPLGHADRIVEIVK